MTKFAVIALTHGIRPEGRTFGTDKLSAISLSVGQLTPFAAKAYQSAHFSHLRWEVFGAWI
jgi:hypothetical protein